MKKIILSVLFTYLSVLVFSQSVTPVPRYRTSKNIVFGTIGGGSSHHLWVLEILREMYNRGHNVSFFSRGDQLHFAKKYPMIKVQQLGGTASFTHHPKMLEQFVKQVPPDSAAMACMEAGLSSYISDFAEHQELFENKDIDLVVCDSFSISCIDAATIKKLPVIITTTFGFFYDNSAPYINNRLYNQNQPTTKHQSVINRIYRDYIRIPYLLKLLSYRLKDVYNFQRQLGLEPASATSAKRFRNIPKLINNVYGIEPSRKHGSFINTVGPVLLSKYPHLDDSSSTFLNDHKKVVYIAFGQHVTSSPDITKVIFHAALKLIEEGHIDGIIWACLNKNFIPESLQTPRRLYTRDDFIHHPNILLIDWSPQYAILQHPSTITFITHGGAASIHEALHLGVRLLVYPFFGDQPGNAISIDRVGVGRYINTINTKYDSTYYENVYDGLKEVVLDPQNQIQNAVDRYSAYIQVRAVNAVTRAADLMEESLFASDNKGKLYYRSDVGEEIHWMKRNDFDIYMAFIILALISVKTVKVLFRNLLFNSSKISLQESKACLNK